MTPGKPSSPVCPMCGEPMLLRRVVRRAYRDTVEVWRCGKCSRRSGGAFSAFIVMRGMDGGKCSPANEPTARRMRSGLMTRSATQRLLEEAEQAIRHCRRHQERQLIVIEKRERIGHDASQARRLLKTLQQLQAEHEANRDRLATELSTADAD